MKAARNFIVGRVVIAALCVAGLASASRVEAQSTCSGDPGGFYCGTFESGNLNGWSIRTGSRITVVTPGLDGSNYKARFFADPTYGSPDMSADFPGKLIPNGSTFWTEFWVDYEPGFQWLFGSCLTCDPVWTGNASFKTYDVRAASVTCTQYGGNRLLLTVWGSSNDSPAWSRGHPFFSIYPNQCAGGTSVATEQYPNVVTNFAFVAGQGPYHVVWEVLSATGSGGRYRVWVNDTLITDVSGIQTCGEPNGCTWNSLQLGGPQANPGSGQYNSFDGVRFTTTNIAPTGGQLASPAGLTVR